MKNICLSLAIGIVGCGGGGEGESEGEVSGVVLSGVVTDVKTGAVIAGAQVRAGDLTGTTDNRGAFSLAATKAGQFDLQVSATGYAIGGRLVEASEGSRVVVELGLLPIDGTATFAGSVGGMVETSDGDGASVTVPPGAFAAEMVTISIASLNAADESELSAFPGDFTTTDNQLLASYGAIFVEARDAENNLLELVDGQTLSATVPVPVGSPDSIDQWFFDPESGQWQADGSGWTGCTEGLCEGTLPHLG